MPLAGKRFEVKFDITGALSGNFAGALKAAMSQMKQLQNAAGKTNAEMSKEMQHLSSYLAQLKKVQGDAAKFTQGREALKQTQQAFQQQQRTTSNLAAQYNQEAAAAEALRQKLEQLRQARDAAKLDATKTQPQKLSDLKAQQALMTKQYNLLSRSNLNNIKGGFEKRDDLKRQLQEVTAAIQAQNAAIKAAKDSYKDLSAQVKATDKQVRVAEKGLKTSGLNVEKSRQKERSLQKDSLQQRQNLGEIGRRLAGNSFNLKDFATSEKALRDEINATIRAMERQKAMEESQARVAPILRQNAALANLNLNELALRRARYQVQLREAAGTSEFKKIPPSTEYLMQAQRLTNRVAEGKYFGTGLDKLQQVQTLAAAYKNLSNEFRANHQLSQKTSSATRSLEQQHQNYSASINNLRAELAKYQSAFDANKKDLSPVAAQQAAEKIKAITAEISQAEKTLAQLGKDLDASKGHKQNLAAAMQTQLQQLRQLRTILSGEGFNTANFAASEQKLRAEIEKTTRALERQAQAQALLDRYSAARKFAQGDINAAKSRYKANLGPTAAEKTDALALLNRYNTINNARKQAEALAALKAQQTSAFMNLNAGSTALNFAWSLLSRLNNLNANPPAVEKFKPATDVLKAVEKINSALKKSGFGEGLKGKENILAAVQAYKALSREMLANQKSYKAIFGELEKAGRNYKNHQNAVRMLQSELSKYKSAYEANKKNLSADEAAKAVANIKSMTAELSNAQKVLSQVEKQMKALGANRQNANGAVEAQMQALRTLQSLLNSAGFSTQNFGASESALRGQIDAATRAMERQAALIERLNTAQNNFNDAQQNYQAAKNFASTILSPFTGSIQYAADFEKEMSAVKALTQMDNLRANNLEKVNEEMGKLTLLAKEQGLRTQFTATDAAKGEKYLAYSGWTQQQIEYALPHMLDIATAAGMTDLGRVSEITSDIMMGFKLKPEEAQRAVDVLTYTFTHSNQNLEQLYETMKYAAPISVGFGSSFEETAAMSKFMVDAGVKGSMAGTSMRAMMTRLVAPPKTITKTLQENGLTLDDANKAWANAHEIAAEYGIDLKENVTAGQQMASVIRQINVKLADRTNQEKMAIFKSITGLYGLSGGMNLFETGGQVVDDPDNKGQKITRLELFTRQLENSHGAATQTADVMRDNYSGATVALESAWQNTKVEIGEALTPTLRVAAEVATTFVKGLMRFADAHPLIVQAAAAIAASLAAMAVTATGAALAFAAFELASAQMALFSAGMAGAEVATAGFAARLGMLARAFKGLAIWGTIAPLLKFGGWAKIGTGIKGAFTGARALGFKGLASMLGGKIIGAAKSAATAIKTIGTAFSSVTRAGLSFVFSPIGLVLTALALTALLVYKNWSRIEPVISSLAQTFSDRIGPAVETAKMALASAGESINALFETMTGSSAADVFLENFVVAIKVIAESIAALVQFVAHSVAAMAELFGGLAKSIDLYYKGDYKGAKKAARIMTSETAYNIEAAFTEPMETLSNIPEGIEQAKHFNRLNKEVARLEKQGVKAYVDRQRGKVIIDSAPTRTQFKTENAGPSKEELEAARKVDQRKWKLAQGYGWQEVPELKKLPTPSEHRAWKVEQGLNREPKSEPPKSKAQKDREYRLWQIDLELAAEEAASQKWRNENAATWQKAQADYNLTKSYFAPQMQTSATLQKAQQDYNSQKNYQAPQIQTSTPPKSESSSTSRAAELALSTAFSTMIKTALFPPFLFSPLLGGSKADAATPESVQQLNTEQAQAQINALGAAAQTNSTTLQAIDAAAQTNVTSLQTADAAAQQLSNSFNTNNAAVTQSAAMFNVSNSALAMNTASVQQNSAAAQVSVGSITQMSGAAQASTGNISSLSSASSNASGSISGLGAAAQSAISSLLAAGASAANTVANAASEIYASAKSYFSGDGAAKNAKGGIYNHGAFLTWFAEKSPEAAIPLDGSERAINLWQTAGQLLGVYPAENYNGGIYKNGGQSISLSKISAKNGKVDLNLNLANKSFNESTENFSSATKQFSNIISTRQPQGPLTPEGVKQQRRIEEELKRGRAKLPDHVKKSKSYEALYKKSGRYPQSVTAPQGRSTTGLLRDILSGNWNGAIEKAGEIYSRKIEIDEWNKNHPDNAPKKLPPVLNAKSAGIISEQQKNDGIFGKIFGHSNPKRDELGNIEKLKKRSPQNVIKADDSEEVKAQKKAAQETEFKRVKKRETYQNIGGAILGIGGLFGLGKIFKKSNAKDQSKILGGLSTILAPVLGDVFGSGVKQPKKFPIEMEKSIAAQQRPPGRRPPLVGRTTSIFTPGGVKEQQRIDDELLRERSKLPDHVRQSKSYEALYKQSGRYPQSVTAPQPRSPVGFLRDIFSGNWGGAFEKMGEIFGRKIEIDDWNETHPDNRRFPDVSKIPVLNAVSAQSQMANPLNAQFETLHAEKTGGTFNQLETSTQNNSTAEMPPINLNFTINIQGNANQQDVENGVKETIPFIQESFESQFKRFIGERSRRAFI